MLPPNAVRLSIPGKVFAAFVALLVTFGGVSAYTIWQVRSLGQGVRQLHATLIPLPPVLGQLKTELAGLDLVLEQEDGAALRRGVHLARRAHPYLARLDTAFQTLNGHLDAGDPAERSLTAPFAIRIKALTADRQALRRDVEAFFSAVDADDAEAELMPRRLAARRQVRRLGRAVALLDVDLNQTLEAAILAFSAQESRARWGAIVLAAVAMVIGLVITVSASRLVRPLRTLRAGVERLARGEYDPPVVIDMPGELGELAADFNHMAAALRNRDAQLSAQQKELLHQERLATVGRMSAQITHELRNPLTSIGLNSELLLEELDLGEVPAATLATTRPLLESIIKEVERLREITEEYLRFARLPRPERTSVDLNRLAAELVEFVRSEMTQADLRIRVDADPSARPAWVDPNQVRAALLNLLRNAREACGPGCHVVVRVRSLGDEATIAVDDDGQGLPPEVQERIFEPFFSTKPQGTGLGLPMVRKIAQAQQGDVAVHAKVGRGTTVVLHLPLAPNA